MTASFARKVAAGNERLYELRIPLADGRTGYYKFSVDPLKETALQKACQDGTTIDLTTFGTILESYCYTQCEPISYPGGVEEENGI